MQFKVLLNNLPILRGNKTLHFDVHFNLKNGESLNIIGSNGSGKSTLLDFLFDEYDANLVDENTKITLDGRHFDGSSSIYIRQNPNSFFIMPNLLAELEYYCSIFAANFHDNLIQLKEIAKKVGLVDILERPIITLSDGEKRFSAIVIACLLKPNIICMDEPFAPLDKDREIFARRLINNFVEQGGILLWASHGNSVEILPLEKNIILENQGLTLKIPNLSDDKFKHIFTPFNKIEISENSAISGVKNLFWRPAWTRKIRNISILHGSTIAIVGKNGSGKTSLLRTLGGVRTLYSGTLRFDTKAIKTRKQLRNYRHNFQSVPQIQSEFIKLMTVDELLECLEIKKMQFASFWEEEFSFANKRLSEFSGGEQNMICVVLALLCQKEFVVLDEPFSYLDQVNSETLSSIFKDGVAKHKTIIYSVHEKSHKTHLLNSEIYEL